MAEEVKRVTTAQNESSDPVAPGTNRRHSWEEFSESGLLWWANRTLHLFGWAIVIAFDKDTDEFVDAYPVRTEWRGFARDREDLGYRRLTNWIKRAGQALDEEVGRGD